MRKLLIKTRGEELSQLENGAGGSCLLKWLFGVLLTALLAAVFFLAVRRHFNHDEFQHIHTAWKILNGEKIYVDFFQNHHPFFYYVLAGIIAVFGENVTTILAMRIFSFLMLLLIILTAYCLSERIFKNRQISLIAILLLAATMIFVDLAIEIESLTYYLR